MKLVERQNIAKLDKTAIDIAGLNEFQAGLEMFFCTLFGAVAGNQSKNGKDETGGLNAESGQHETQLPQTFGATLTTAPGHNQTADITLSATASLAQQPVPLMTA